MKKVRSTLAAATDDGAASEKRRSPIAVVLGMHRSGSSAISRGLLALGVNLGDNLMPPVAGNNDKGFWEDLDIYRFNEELLKKAGSAWDKLGRIDRAAFTGPAFSAERRTAAALLAQKTEAGGLFGFKDPRTAVLLPLWQCVFEDLSLDDRYVISVRNPLSSAASLNTRDGFPMEKGVLLWAKHMLEAVRETAGKKRIFVSYDRILADPLAELRRIAAILDLPSPEADNDAVRTYADEYLTRGLRHNIVGDRELARSGLAPDFVQELYRLVNGWADQRNVDPPLPDGELWESLESRYSEVAPILSYADFIEDGRRRSETNYRESQAALKKSDADRQSLAAARAGLEDELRKLKDTLDKLRSSNAAEIGMLTEEKARLEARLRAVEEALKTSEADGLSLVGERDRLAEEMRGLKEELRILRDELEKHRQDADAEIGSLTREKESALQRLRVVEEALDKSRAESAAAIREITAERDEIARAMTVLREETEASLAATRQKMEREAEAFRVSGAALVRERDEALALAETREGARKLEEGRARDALQRAESLEKERQGLAFSLAERVREIDGLTAASAALERGHKEMKRELLLTRASMNAMRRSASWRISVPVRAVGMIVRDPLGGARAVARGGLRKVWRALPMAPEARGRLAGRLFAAAPFLFFWSGAYKAWKAERGQAETRRPREQSLLIAEPDPALEGCAPLKAKEPPAHLPARAIAFYLPQFHRIPENDAWWGEGFTEWTKVRPARPLFEGHYQPHEPGELGYYDLASDGQAMARQAELATLHGIGGFAFYFYWFAGKRLLEAPLQKYLQSAEIAFPFCLCWANENWSRRWDGGDNDILIAQDHSPEDDLAFISHIAQYVRDPRYIRIGGRPLLIVYRPALLPNAKKTAERWRRWARENGLGELYLAYTQSFEKSPPSAYGFDAAIEFPPNNSGQAGDPSLVKSLPADSQLAIYDWRKLAGKSLSYDRPDYNLFRSVNCGWDNTARRPRDGAVFVNATPSAYKVWLQNALADTLHRFADPEERLVFINAWNEWAEGAHLEPDRKHGYAWLEATRQALARAGESKKKILIVTHDLHKHGAQYLALNILRTLKRRYGFDVASIAGGPGDLAAAYEAEGPLAILDVAAVADDDVDATLAGFAGQGFGRAIVNSAASGWLAPALARHGFEMIGLVHEMPSMIGRMKLEENLRALDRHARAVVFPAAIVRDKAARAAGIASWKNAVIAPQGVYKLDTVGDLDEKRGAREAAIRSLGLPRDAEIVLGAGYADERKGVDIFIKWASAAAARWPNLHFVWLGAIDPAMKAKCDALLVRAGKTRGNIHFPGFIEQTGDFYRAARLYALTSREDPFPSTALEALAAATPVVMIRGTGGIEDLAAHPFVKAADSEDAGDFLSAAGLWLDSDAARLEAGRLGRDAMRERFGFASYVGRLNDILGTGAPNISVVVPNYNYAHCLEKRLASILDQSLSPREIIFLDDASTDDSVAVAEAALRHSPVNWRIVRNDRNSGSVFAQWRKGVDLASGDCVWIAEADDWADRRFLETAAQGFARDDVVLSYTQSQQAAADGRVTAPDYLDYVRDVSPDRWTRSYVASGLEEAREGLSVKNTIPNVSAVLFRRAALAEVLRAHAREIESYRVAGDWCVYVNILRQGAIAFDPAPLNYHRRHEDSVTISRFGLAELAEIARMQAYVARQFAPPEACTQRASAYLENLVRHFGLAGRYSAAEIDAAKRGAWTAPPSAPLSRAREEFSHDLD